MFKFAPFKDASKMGWLKYCKKYILSNDDDKLHYKFLKTVESEIKNDEFSANCLSLKKY